VEVANYDLPADILCELHKQEGEITDQDKALLAGVGVVFIVVFGMILANE